MRFACEYNRNVNIKDCVLRRVRQARAIMRVLPAELSMKSSRPAESQLLQNWYL